MLCYNCILEIKQTMTAPVYFMYKLGNFYQNHRRYIQSKSNFQLAGIFLFTLRKLNRLYTSWSLLTKSYQSRHEQKYQLEWNSTWSQCCCKSLWLHWYQLKLSQLTLISMILSHFSRMESQFQLIPQEFPGQVIKAKNTKELPTVRQPNGLTLKMSILLCGWERQDFQILKNFGELSIRIFCQEIIQFKWMQITTQKSGKDLAR